MRMTGLGLLSGRVGIVCGVLFCGSGLAVCQSESRPISPQDLNRREEIVLESLQRPAFSFSPDGRQFAYTVRRSKESSKQRLAMFSGALDYSLDGDERDDIWLLDVANQTTSNLTGKETNESGF